MDVMIFLIRYSIVPVMIVFVLLVVITYWPGRRARFDRDAQIPLRDDN